MVLPNNTSLCDALLRAEKIWMPSRRCCSLPWLPAFFVSVTRELSGGKSSEKASEAIALLMSKPYKIDRGFLLSWAFSFYGKWKPFNEKSSLWADLCLSGQISSTTKKTKIGELLWEGGGVRVRMPKPDE